MTVIHSNVSDENGEAMEHDVASGDREGYSKTFSLPRQGLSVLNGNSEKDTLLPTHCTKSGACPCQAPCVWGQQVQDDLQRDGWPSPAPHRQDDLPEDNS